MFFFPIRIFIVKHLLIFCCYMSLSLTLLGCDKKPNTDTLAAQQQEPAPTLQQENQAPEIFSNQLIELGQGFSGPLPIFISDNNNDELSVSLLGEDAHLFHMQGVAIFFNDKLNRDQTEFVFTVKAEDQHTSTTKQVKVHISGMPASKQYAQLFGQPIFSQTSRAVKACLPAKRQLKENERFYKDYIALLAKPLNAQNYTVQNTFSVNAIKDSLCFTSLKFGHQYVVSIKKGFPFAKTISEKNFSINLSTPDQNPSIKLSRSTFILPPSSGAKLPIELTNVSNFEIIVVRMSVEQLKTELGDDSFNYNTYYGDIEYKINEMQLIGREKVSVELEKNKATTVNLDLSKIIKNNPVGAYTIMIVPNEHEIKLRNWDDLIFQKVVYTDVGLVSYRAKEGLYVYTMSYQSGAPLSNIVVDLVANNSEILSTKTSNSQGKVFFADPLLQGKGGMAPVHVRAIQENEFAFIDFNLNQLDLTQHNIDGKLPLKPINAFVTTERGVYRNNEDVYISTILRDEQKQGISPSGIQLQIIKPDGNVASSELIRPSKNGVFQRVYNIPQNERTGQFLVKVYHGEQTTLIGQTHFEVADYIPQTIKLDISLAQNNYSNLGLAVGIKSDYLYGAPAASLGVEGSISFAKNRRLFNQYPDYIFGDASKIYTKTKQLARKKLNKDGQLNLPIQANLLPDSYLSQPITANIRIGVQEDSGRINYKSKTITALLSSGWVGIESKQDNPSYSLNKAHTFNVINLNKSGQAIEGNTLTYNIIEEEREYHWYTRAGEWKYRVESFDKDIVDSGSVNTNKQGQAQIAFSDTDWGYYRLEIEDSESQNRTSLSFSVGYSGNTESFSSPEKVTLTSNEDVYKAGDTIKLNVAAPYTGKLHLIVANDKVLADKWIDLTNNQQLVPLTIDKNWGDQFYITAMVFRPHASTHGPARAVGVKHVFVEQEHANANITLHVPDKIRPNGALNIEIESALKEGGEVVVMAVDKGILNLTRFKTPNPYHAFYAKQALNLPIFDLYQHLIQYKKGEVLSTSFGGDANLSVDATLRENIFNPTVLVSAPIKVDNKGRASLTFDVPQFNGQLQIMAIGADATKLGASEAKTIVASPITISPLMPRFAHVSDSLTVGINVHNLEIPKANIELEWLLSEGLRDFGSQQTVTLNEGEKRHVLIDIQAVKLGMQEITANIKVNGEDYESHTYKVNVENLQPDIYKTEDVVLAANKMTTFSPLIENIDIRNISAALSTSPALNVDHYVHQLRRYPLGCLEQTSSKAWGYLSSTNAISDITKTKLLQQAIVHIGTMQQTDGGFSAWPEGDQTEQWLSMYATDLMLHIHKAYKDEIPNSLLAPALAYANSISGGNTAIKVYAQYIIASAQAQLVDKGEVRYLSSLIINGQELPSLQTVVFLLLTNDKLGYTENVQALYKKLLSMPNDDGWSRLGYTSELKSKILRAFVVSQANTLEKAQTNTLTKLVQEVKTATANEKWISTHEKAWLMRLSAGINQDDSLWENTALTMNEKALSKSDIKSQLLDAQQALAFNNQLKTPVFLTLSYDGISQTPLTASNNDIHLSTQYLSVDGTSVIDIKQVKQGTEVLVMHRIGILSERDAEISIDAPIPAGFELENPKLSGLRASPLKLIKTQPSFEEFRDARYLAAWSLPFGKKDLKDGLIHVHYVMRAVSKGQFVKPAIVVEDMYRPYVRANSAQGKVIID